MVSSLYNQYADRVELFKLLDSVQFLTALMSKSEYALKRPASENFFFSNCFVSQTYFVASELRPTVVFTFVLNGPGVVIVICSPGYRSSSIVVCNFVSIVICIVEVSFFVDIKRGPQ